MSEHTERLEYLRSELRAERISWGELHELQGLAEHIEPGDVELLEAAGVPEFPEPCECDDGEYPGTFWTGDPGDEVQRCDLCKKFKYDDEAAHSLHAAGWEWLIEVEWAGDPIQFFVRRTRDEAQELADELIGEPESMRIAVTPNRKLTTEEIE